MARIQWLAHLALVVSAAACDGNDPKPPDGPGTAWQLGPAMPRRALEPGVGVLGQQVVVAGGFVDELELTARVDAFDVQDQAWRALPDAPVRWSNGNLATVGATLYLLGGLEGTDQVAQGAAFALDSVSQTWRTLAPMAEADARGAAGVVDAPGRVYLLGGASTTGALASCLFYDTIADRWDRLPDLPAPRAHPAAMRRADGSLIVTGGFASRDASAPRGDTWLLPPGGTAWLPVAAMPSSGEALHGGCAYGVVLGQLVCAGGAASATVDAYDPFDDEWATVEAMPAPRGGTQGAAIGSKLYIPGGSASRARAPTDTLYVYDPFATAAR